MNSKKNPPVVMCFSGSDPTGGAGIQADIETLASLDCHCSPIITALTAQDTTNIQALYPVSADIIMQQAESVLEDMQVHVFKIGLIGNIEVAQCIVEIISNFPEIPVIFDPILSAGGGANIVDDELLEYMVEELLPESSICTPNSVEARILANNTDDLDRCGYQLLDHGCSYALITGSHESSPLVQNTLYSLEEKPVTASWERLPAMYHGSGCTLSSAIAGIVAQGLGIPDACNEAQEFTWNALAYGGRLGQGQLLPNRFFWSRSEENDDE